MSQAVDLANQPVVQWIVYGLAGTLGTLLAVIGSLIVYTVKNITNSVSTLEHSFDELVETLGNLANKFELNQATMESQFNYEVAERTRLVNSLRKHCEKNELRIKSLKKRCKSNVLEIRYLKSKLDSTETFSHEETL